jgi:alpha-tubulin suppressor-like RCC1 family protein
VFDQGLGGKGDAGLTGVLATDSVYGISKLSVAAVDPLQPIAIGDNDPRIATKIGIWTAGGGYDGTLGDGTSNTRFNLAQIDSKDTDWKALNSIGGSNSATLVIKQNGTLWGWGGNYGGQLGNGNSNSISTPSQIGNLTDWSVIGHTQCGTHVLAIKTDETLWGWGNNSSGSLGLGDVVNRSSPVQISAQPNWACCSGGYQSSAAIKTGGTLWTWGNDVHGQLGDGTVSSRSSPVQVGLNTDWAAIASGAYHVAAIKTDGTLWAWGNDAYGQLGDETVISRSSPIQIGALTDWSSIACGYYNTAAIKTNGTLWVWGLNNYGQIGDDTIIDKSSPVQVGNRTDWVQVSCGNNLNTIAVRSDKTVWSWGNNQDGQLGDGTDIHKSSPVQIGAFTKWSQVLSGGWSITLVGDISYKIAGDLTPIYEGGTGQATAVAAVNALLPIQTGNAGKTLLTDGSNVSWQAAASPLTSLPYDIAFYLATIATFDINTLITGFLSPRSMIITDGVGNVAKCSVSPIGIDTIFTLAKNGTQFATVTFAIGSTTGTIVFTAGSPVSIAIGDVITLLTGATKDGSVAGIGITFVGVSPIV